MTIFVIPRIELLEDADQRLRRQLSVLSWWNSTKSLKKEKRILSLIIFLYQHFVHQL